MELVLKYGVGRFSTNPLHFLVVPELGIRSTATLVRVR